MKVVVVHSPYLARGGEDVQVDREVAALRAAGHSVEVVAPERADSRAGRLVSAAIAAADRGRDRVTRELVRSVRAARPDLVHVHNLFPWAGPEALDALVGSDAPAVVSLHNFRAVCAAGTLARSESGCEQCVGRGRLAAVGHRCYRRSALLSAGAARYSARLLAALERVAGSAAIVAPSEWAARSLERVAPGLGRIEVLSDIAESCAHDDRHALRGRLLIASRLSPEKGIRFALEGVARAAIEDVEVRVVGDGPEKQALKQVAERRGVRASFAGRLSQDEVCREMGSASACLVPSMAPETFGLSAAEACWGGVPVVVADSGALPETVGGGECALIVGADDPDAWAAAIVQMVSDPDSAAERAEKARQMARERYSGDAHVRRLVRLWSVRQGGRANG